MLVCPEGIKSVAQVVETGIRLDFERIILSCIIDYKRISCIILGVE